MRNYNCSERAGCYDFGINHCDGCNKCWESFKRQKEGTNMTMKDYVSLSTTNHAYICAQDGVCIPIVLDELEHTPGHPVKIVCHETTQYDEYVKADIDMTKLLVKQQINSVYGKPKTPYTPEIDKVIFNDPATIVFWKDGTKTVVKCGEDDIYDPEKGLAMAFVKKVLGNKGNYYNEIKKWLGEYETYYYEPSDMVENELLKSVVERLSERLKNYTYGGEK